MSVLAERMAALLLTSHAPLSVVDIVGHLGAMQAQDLPASRWAIGVRAGQAMTEAQVIEAYDAGEIVRSWPFRGTLHACRATDLDWIRELSADKLFAGAARRREGLGIDDALIDRAVAATKDRLGAGGRATRAEILEFWLAEGVDCSGQRAYHLIWTLAQRGLMTWGPFHQGEQQLVLNSEWIRDPQRYERTEALGELLVRYVRGHGPVGLPDFRWWTGLSAGDAKQAVAAAGDRLRCDEGLYRLADAAPADDLPELVALPGFDEHLLGYKDRSLMLDPMHSQAVVPGNNGMFMSTLVRRGRVVATWHRTKRAASVKVEVRPLPEHEPPSSDELAQVFEPYAHFIGTPVAH